MIDSMVRRSSSKPPWVVLAVAAPGALHALTFGSPSDATSAPKYFSTLIMSLPSVERSCLVARHPPHARERPARESDKRSDCWIVQPRGSIRCGKFGGEPEESPGYLPCMTAALNCRGATFV